MSKYSNLHTYYTFEIFTVHENSAFKKCIESERKKKEIFFFILEKLIIFLFTEIHYLNGRLFYFHYNEQNKTDCLVNLHRCISISCNTSKELMNMYFNNFTVDKVYSYISIIIAITQFLLNCEIIFRYQWLFVDY